MSGFGLVSLSQPTYRTIVPRRRSVPQADVSLRKKVANLLDQFEFDVVNAGPLVLPEGQPTYGAPLESKLRRICANCSIRRSASNAAGSSRLNMVGANLGNILIGLLPLVLLGLSITGCYQRQPSLLEAVVVGALGWGLAAVTSLEVLSLAGAINRLSVIAFWCLASIGATVMLIRHRRVDVGAGQPLAMWLAIPSTFCWRRVRQPSLRSILQ